MRWVRILTAAFVVAGAALAATGLVLGRPELTLAGVLMLWAGAVKIVVAAIWRHLGTDRAMRAPDGSYR
ncbi:MAG: hypothetical protein ACKOWF_06745 [Chloroflexota bacterium]